MPWVSPVRSASNFDRSLSHSECLKGSWCPPSGVAFKFFWPWLAVRNTFYIATWYTGNTHLGEKSFCNNTYNLTCAVFWDFSLYSISLKMFLKKKKKCSSKLILTPTLMTWSLKTSPWCSCYYYHVLAKWSCNLCLNTSCRRYFLPSLRWLCVLSFAELKAASPIVSMQWVPTVTSGATGTGLVLPHMTVLLKTALLPHSLFCRVNLSSSFSCSSHDMVLNLLTICCVKCHCGSQKYSTQ